MLNLDFKEFIKLLNDNNVHYLVVGGYAVAFHGHPRYTKDLDLWLWLDPENAANVIQALQQFGFGSLGLTAEDFLQPGQIIQLGYPPCRIDLLTTISGLDFTACYPARIQVEIDDIIINFIDLENLKKNKKAAARYQDLADLENLE